jgi:hypothetical protein
MLHHCITPIRISVSVCRLTTALLHYTSTREELSKNKVTAVIVLHTCR